MKHLTFYAFLLLTPLLLPTLLFATGDYEARIREAELKGDRAAVETLCREWYQSGAYSPGVLNWCYNALMSVEAGAVLITQNDYDTYPVWMLQYALGVRPDVSVLSLPLLEDKDYREKIIHLNPMKYVPAAFTLPEFLNNLLSDRGEMRNNPVYFSAVIEKGRIETNKQHLYLTGLALKFSRTTFDNLSVLRSNVENTFRTDYLDLDFQKETLPEVVRTMNVSYLPAFYLLYKHYIAAGESVKAAKLQRLSLRIGREAGQEEQVRSFFFPIPAAPGVTFSTGIKAKELEKRMKKIKDNFWAGETEVTNGEYEQFLSDLLKNKEYALLDSCKSAKTDWRAMLPEQFKQLDDAAVFKHGHPDAAGHPVQNISHAAAQRYCEWITRIYNADSGKKKFKKVLFRLPTKAEWENFAAFGLSNTPYPWGGYYVRNSKGCYLGNYFSTEPCKDCPDQASDANDGGFFTVPASSYFPNNAGLYCISGNVAEMVSEPGITKGGSWQDEAYYGQIKTDKPYTSAGPSIGFRVIMEILE